MPSRCPTNSAQRILVVDDDELIRQSVSLMLSSNGYEIETAEDGADAWEALQTKGYDLLITDNYMPEVSGVELIARLRSAQIKLPVILASGTLSAEELDGNPWMQLAATLPKPFTQAELLATVKKVLAGTGAHHKS